MPNHTDFIALTLAQDAVKAPTAQPPTSDQVISGAPSTTSTTGQPSSNTTNSTQQQSNPFGFMLPILLIVVLFMVMSAFTGRKDKKKREALMSSLGKGDKVITIGGQIGIVDQVRDNEVVLRTDENSNAKARFSKAAIQQILESAGSPASNGEATAVEVKTRNDKALTAK